MRKNYIIGVLFVLLLTSSYFVFDFNSRYTESLNEYDALETKSDKQIADTNSDLKELQVKFDETKAELETVMDNIECNITQDISYVSNSSASDSLKVYVGDIGGNVVWAEWDSIWSDAITSIHKLSTSEFLYVFIVYFDEFGFPEGTWYVDGQCWVELP